MTDVQRHHPIVSAETLHRDTPAGLFNIDKIQEHMKGGIYGPLTSQDGGKRQRRREKRVFIATNPFLL